MNVAPISLDDDAHALMVGDKTHAVSSRVTFIFSKTHNVSVMCSCVATRLYGMTAPTLTLPNCRSQLGKRASLLPSGES